MRAAAALIVVVVCASASAQDAIELGAARDQAAAADPRLRQLELEAAQSALRLRSLDAERKPALLLEGQAQHQSEVVQFPGVPGGMAPDPPKDTFDAHVGVEQRLLDPTRKVRADDERARLAEAQARIRTELFALRREVDEAFFAAALLQERETQVATVITDLEARLREARLRVDEGVSLPSEAEAIEATLLQRQLETARLRAGRKAALARLGELVGRPLDAEDRLVLPDLTESVAAARSRLADVRDRPEFVQFARTRDRLAAQARLVHAQEQPRVSAYGRAGIGRPGLNFISRDVNPYWLAGIRVQWSPWSWGSSARERERLALQQEIVRTSEEAFARTQRRAVQDDLATIDQLDETAALDDRIVALRESIEQETRARYDERVITAADYVDKQTDVLEARLLRAAHRVERAQAQARFLNVLGLEAR